MKLIRVRGLNPFIFGGDKVVDNIIFFNDKKEKIIVGRGWFGSNNMLGELIIPDIKRKNKENLDKKESFFMTSHTGWRDEKRINLFLYEDGKDIKLVNVYRRKEVMDMSIYHFVKYEYKIFDKTVSFELVERIEQTDFGKQVTGMQEELKKEGIKISEYDLKRIMEKYDLVRKG